MTPNPQQHSTGITEQPVAKPIRKQKNPYFRSWNVPTSGSSGVAEVWKVSQRLDGTFACTCPAWKFHRAPKPECHHIAAVRAQPGLEFKATVARATGSAAPCPRLENQREEYVPRTRYDNDGQSDLIGALDALGNVLKKRA